MSERGFTLVEVLIALAITGIVLVAMLPAFLTHLDTNTGNEIRTECVSAAQQVMETLRRQDPALLPSSGSSDVQVLQVGDRSYEAVTKFCSVPALCTPNSRHLFIEVSHGGRIVYTVESVYTQLR